jgi:hypothetical protein
MSDNIRLYVPDDGSGLPPGQNEVECYLTAHRSFQLELYAAGSREGSWKIVSHPEQADVVVVREPRGFKNWNWIPHLQSSMLLRRFAEKIVVYNADDLAVPFFPGFYTSLVKSTRYDIEAAPFPYWKTLVDHTDAGSIPHHDLWLWYFRGALRTHRIRRKLYRALSDNPSGQIEVSETRWGSHQEDEREIYVRGMRKAKFALCPRGASPSSFRLYEAMQLGVAPVVISDDWRPPEEIAWREFAVFIKEAEVGTIPGVLAALSDESTRRGRIAREEWRRTLSSEQIAGCFLKQLRCFLETKWVPRTFDELWAIWHSREYARNSNWHLAGRVRSRIRGLVG